MADTTWTNTGEEALFPAKSNRLKFVVGGILICSRDYLFGGECG